MFNIQENIDLASMTTFGVPALVRYYGTFSSIDDLKKMVQWSQDQSVSYFCLGGGSNVLFVGPYEGLVIHNEIKGRIKTNETSDTVYLTVGAGENWSDLVTYCVEQGWGGAENLSLIPGTVGAAPIQNIGAYGVEVKDIIRKVQVFDTTLMKEVSLTPAECQFGYRDSIFKKSAQGRFIVTAVDFAFDKNPILRTQYGTIDNELKKMKVLGPKLADVARAVIAVRQAKLPDPKVLGNAGSFFKNPVIPMNQYENLKKFHSAMVAFPEKEGFKKIAAGWLIENVGLKGYTEGPCGVHKDQALVLVNYGGATGLQILNIANKVKKMVYERFQIELEMEVNLIGQVG